MGFRICYLATKAEPEEFSKALGLALGEQSPEMPHGEWWVAHLKASGWTILWSEDEEFGQSSLDRIAELSREFETYICEVNETVMWSSAEFWQHGLQKWRVTHAGDGKDIFDLNEIGSLPDNFEQIKTKHFANQRAEGEDVDHIFEIPLDLAALDIGFRHEDFLQPGDVDMFLLLTVSQKGGLLSRLFGR